MEAEKTVAMRGTVAHTEPRVQGETAAQPSKKSVKAAEDLAAVSGVVIPSKVLRVLGRERAPGSIRMMRGATSKKSTGFGMLAES